MTKRIAIVEGVRTPFIKAWTQLERVPAQELGAIAIRELLQQTDLKPVLVDEVILGCVAQPVDAANVARVSALLAGIPNNKKAYTVQRNCASGFESVTSAAEKILVGQDAVVIAGGTESMSNAPFVFDPDAASLFVKLSRARTLGERLRLLSQFRPFHFKPHSSLQSALTDPVCGLGMGETAEVLAKKFAISRERQDAFALQSHVLAQAARTRIADEICRLLLAPDYNDCIQEDNGIRENQTLAALSKLRPIFDKKFGTVTAGNSSQITDGACALLVMEEERARSLGYEVLGFIKAYEYVGLAPSEMGLGPAFAIERVLSKTGLTLKDIALFEINEAFAVQVLACLDAMASKKFAQDNFPSGQPLGEIDLARLNVNGGAIALGHPVGVSGARLVLTCLKEMKRRGLDMGLVAACVGGGQGGALMLERVR